MFSEEKKTADPTDVESESENYHASALSELEAVAASGMDATEILKRYIQLCPFVDGRGPAATAALEGIARLEAASDSEQQAYPADVSGIEKTVVAPGKSLFKAGVGILARLIFLDFPLIFLLVVHYSFSWASFVQHNYVHDQLNAMIFSTTRSEEETTYYSRKCEAIDLTTHDGNDLFLPLNATTEEAYQHQLLHGFTIFQEVLSEDTMVGLRSHIVDRNRQLTARESIYVIEGDNRFSFGLGTEEPTVTRAVREIANHWQLRPALAKILGPNPALIEMTAITSSYGAINQYYHDDVIPTGSAIRYARTFGPSYSVFIQLQNTTKEMGATGACPGTHYCSAGAIDDLCEKEGFQLVGDNGYWGAGDALLMNMNSYHRGAAHTDEDAPDRVMLILTFTPRPNKRTESRQMSQGITFSLRWDMWGHTLEDLAHAETEMTQPWATLRSLGLYKSAEAEWGVDYITGSSMRMANEDYGFKNDEGQLDEFIKDGGFHWLPEFLKAKKEDESDGWYEYLQDSFYNCKDFADKVLRYAVGAYLAIFLPMSVFGGSRRKVGRRAVLRLLLFWALCVFLYKLAKWHVAQTEWAADIKAGRRYANFFKNQTLFGIAEVGPTTFPDRRDVLVETRFGSEYLHLYEDYINGHRGNRYFLEHVREIAKTYASYPDFLKDASVRYVMSAIEFNLGRFLHQGASGRWHLMSDKRAEAYVKRTLEAYSNDAVGMVTKAIRHLESEYMYGIHRQTILAQKHSVPYLRALDAKILGVPDDVDIPEETEADEPEPKYTFQSLSALPALPLCSDKLSLERTVNRLPPSFEAVEPQPGAWIVQGDTIEHLNEGYWYVAKVDWIDSLGKCLVIYANGEESNSNMESVRNFDPYEVGEEVEVVGEDEYYYACTIEDVNEDGTYDVYHEDFAGDGIIHGTEKEDLRREAVEGDGVSAEYRSAYG